jgi:hypothetical protein
MPKAFIWLLFATPTLCSAQSTSSLLGARAAGMGYATAALPDEWAFFNNIAGLASEKNPTVASAFDVHALLPGGNRLGALVSVPFAFGVGGFGVFRFGDDIYSEQIVSIGFANTIGKTSLGARISYMQYKAQGLGTHGALGINLGGITQLTPQLSIGAWIQNINQPNINFSDKEKAPVKLLAALSFKVTDKFLLASEIEKDVLYEPLWKTGMEYWIHKKVAARMGLNVNPGSAFFGLGFKSGRIKIDYAFQSFTSVGPSHQASASYRLNKNPKEPK